MEDLDTKNDFTTEHPAVEISTPTVTLADVEQFEKLLEILPPHEKKGYLDSFYIRVKKGTTDPKTLEEAAWVIGRWEEHTEDPRSIDGETVLVTHYTYPFSSHAKKLILIAKQVEEQRAGQTIQTIQNETSLAVRRAISSLNKIEFLPIEQIKFFPNIKKDYRFPKKIIEKSPLINKMPEFNGLDDPFAEIDKSKWQGLNPQKRIKIAPAVLDEMKACLQALKLDHTGKEDAE